VHSPPRVPVAREEPGGGHVRAAPRREADGWWCWGVCRVPGGGTASPQPEGPRRARRSPPRRSHGEQGPGLRHEQGRPVQDREEVRRRAGGPAGGVDRGAVRRGGGSPRAGPPGLPGLAEERHRKWGPGARCARWALTAPAGPGLAGGWRGALRPRRGEPSLCSAARSSAGW